MVYLLLQSRGRRAAEAEAAEQRKEVAHLMRVSVLGELSGAIAHEIRQPLTAILSNAQAALELLEHKSPISPKYARRLATLFTKITGLATSSSVCAAC